MFYRITDASSSSRLTDQINTQRARAATAQEQVASGKRINRNSDDPFGAAAVLQLRNSQAAIDQFRRNSVAANQALETSDGALNSYQPALDRVRALLSQGSSGFTPDSAKKAIATELDGLRQSILNIANQQGNNGSYIFGGTRQDLPPFDPTTAVPAATPTAPQAIQLEPNAAPIAVGVTADTVFTNQNGSIFDVLATASAALRGTGNPAADQAAIKASFDQIVNFADQAAVARTAIGKSLNGVEAATDRLGRDSLSLESSAQQIEAVDFADASLKLVDSERALEAVLQTNGLVNRKSLLDFIG